MTSTASLLSAGEILKQDSLGRVRTPLGKRQEILAAFDGAGKRSAVIYTIIESCRRRAIDPHEYLRDVLTRITETTNWQVAELTPEKWAEKKLSLKKVA